MKKNSDQATEFGMDDHENPYEEQPLVGYELSSIRESEERELSMLDDEELSPEQLEEALRIVRIKYLTVTWVIYAFFGLLGSLFCWLMFKNVPFKHTGDVVLAIIALVMSTLCLISAIGLAFRAKWGKQIGLITARLLVIMIPVGTLFGLFALTSIRDCAPEFE